MIRTDGSNKRGQVGIGTLIIFIAMVLVAAVAAGVLIDTAGLLESRASDTGNDAQAQVSNQIDVVSATGEVSSSNVSTVTLVVKKSPGSDPLDLEKATIQYVSDSNATTLQYAGSASATAFSVTNVKGDSVLDNTDERSEVAVNASAVESDNGIAPGEEVTLRIVDQSGATTTYGVNVPQTFGGATYVEV